MTSEAEDAFGRHWRPGAGGGARRAQSQLSALPFCDGERHVLQPLLVGLWCTDLGDDRAE